MSPLGISSVGHIEHPFGKGRGVAGQKDLKVQNASPDFISGTYVRGTVVVLHGCIGGCVNVPFFCFGCLSFDFIAFERREECAGVFAMLLFLFS